MPSSTIADGRSELARANTFQRMLELERKNKVHRMQASQKSPNVHTSTTLGRNSSSQREPRPSPLHTTSRAMTTPLPISIPAQVLSNGNTKKYVVNQSGEIIPQEDEETENDSDTSSICHSPGWDDFSGKKKRQQKKLKEIRRREKEKAEKENKGTLKAMAKLSKPPPANSSKKLSRMSISIDRSNPAPQLPTTADAPLSTAEPSLPRPSTSMPRPSMSMARPSMPAGRPSTSTTRPRKGSLEVGIKSFIAARTSISVPWKSSHNLAAQNTQSHELVPARTASKTTSSGFIGGLKLRQSEEAATQDMIRQVKKSGGDDVKGLLSTDSLLKSSTNLSSTASLSDSIRPISIYEESVRTPQQWEDIYSQAAMLARGPHTSEPLDETPIMDRNIKKKKKHPPTSRYFPLESEDSNSSRRDPSVASTRNSAKSGTSGEDRNGSGQRPTSTISAERPPTGRNNSLDQARGRSSGYVNHSRKQSHDQSLAGFQDEVQVSEVNDTRRPGSSRSSFFRISSRTQEPSREAPSTTRPGTRDSSIDARAKDPILTNPFTNDDFVLPSLHLGGFTASPLDETPTHHRKTPFKSSQTFPGLKGLKVVTNAAFSKSSIDKPLSEKQIVIPPSPTGSFVSAVETQSTMRPSIPDRALTTGHIDERISAEVERDPPATIIQDFAIRPRSSARASPDTIRQRPKSRSRSRNPPIYKSTGSSTSSQSRSITDSSEDCSTPDEFSNITTPSMSRPRSEIDFSKSTDELGQGNNKLRRRISRDQQSMLYNGLNGHPVMMGAIQGDDVPNTRDSWCRSAMPMDLSDSEDRMKTPTGNKSITDFASSSDERSSANPAHGPPPKTSDGLSNASGIQRKPSLARSISTPDLQQDLSFLPTLKHQALVKPAKKGKGFLGRRTKHEKQASVSNDDPEPTSPTALVRPPNISIIPTTKSEGSSPTTTSPQLQPPSQYLQNARLNIGARSPKFPHSGNPHLSTNLNAEPVAKMFVVCCSCKYFHDMPSKIYECMAKPDNVVTDTKLGVSGVVSTSVKCPWCGHGMSTSCCAGYAAVVHLREKFH